MRRRQFRLLAAMLTIAAVSVPMTALTRLAAVPGLDWKALVETGGFGAACVVAYFALLYLIAE